MAMNRDASIRKHEEITDLEDKLYPNRSVTISEVSVPNMVENRRSIESVPQFNDSTAMNPWGLDQDRLELINWLSTQGPMAQAGFKDYKFNNYEMWHYEDRIAYERQNIAENGNAAFQAITPESRAAEKRIKDFISGKRESFEHRAAKSLQDGVVLYGAGRLAKFVGTKGLNLVGGGAKTTISGIESSSALKTFSGLAKMYLGYETVDTAKNVVLDYGVMHDFSDIDYAIDFFDSAYNVFSKFDDSVVRGSIAYKSEGDGFELKGLAGVANDSLFAFQLKSPEAGKFLSKYVTNSQWGLGKKDNLNLSYRYSWDYSYILDGDFSGFLDSGQWSEIVEMDVRKDNYYKQDIKTPFKYAYGARSTNGVTVPSVNLGYDLQSPKFKGFSFNAEFRGNTNND
jgi:hypothetical protein